MPLRPWFLLFSTALFKRRVKVTRRTLIGAAWGIALGMLFWAATASLPPSAHAQAFCDQANVPQAYQACEGWGAPPIPGADGTACKLEEYDGQGTSIVPPQSATCYPPGASPPPGAFPCQVLTGPGTWGMGSCVNSPPGVPPPQGLPSGMVPGVLPPPPPPPTPPAVSAASCTRAPPSTWYDPDAPVNSTATSWNEPTQPDGMIIRNVPINGIAPAWAIPARNIASTLFNALFLFEIFILGLQAIVHRDGVAHLFSGLTFKTFVATFFIYLMANAPTILPPIINYSFKIAGQQSAAVNTTNLMSMYHQADSAAELFFCAAMASHIDDNETALAYGHTGSMLGIPGAPGTPAKNDYVDTLQGAVGHITFEFFVQALGMLVIAGAGIMFLSLALITAESYIAMFAGILFLAFSSTRFTLPFTQGYFAYALNVGVKMFAYWILIAVESTALLPLLQTAGQGLIDAASIEFGSQVGKGEETYLISATAQVMQILAMGALTWFLPNALGRFVSDRHSTSALNLIAGLADSLRVKKLSPALATAPPSLSAGMTYPAPQELHTSLHIMAVRENTAPIPTQEQYAAPTSQQSPRTGHIPFSPADTFAPSASPVFGPMEPITTPVGIEAMQSDTPPQVVQVSVADGGDPFAAKPRPVVIPLHAHKQLAPPNVRNMKDAISAQTGAAILQAYSSDIVDLPNEVTDIAEDGDTESARQPFAPAEDA